jgi:hypothetical protein
MFVPSCGPVLTAVGGTFVPGYGPVLFDGFGAPECVPSVGMVLV